MFREINLRDRNTQIRCHFLRGPLLEDVAIENLILLRIDLSFHPRDRGLQSVLPPFFIPNGIEIETRGIRDALDRRGARFAMVACGSTSLRRSLSGPFDIRHFLLQQRA